MNIAMLMMAGSGTRFGADIPKQFVEIEGRPIFAYVLKAYNCSPSVDKIVIVTHKNWIDYVEEWKEKLGADKLEVIVAGGSTRSESVKNGLISMVPFASDDDVILIHDITHPYMDEEGTAQIIEAVKECGGATLGQRQYDTVYSMNAETHMLEEVVPREKIVSGASPEAFTFKDIYRIYMEASQGELDTMTSAGAIALHYGIPMKVIPANVINLKITYKNDMETLKELLHKYFPHFRNEQKKYSIIVSLNNVEIREYFERMEAEADWTEDIQWIIICDLSTKANMPYDLCKEVDLDFVMATDNKCEDIKNALQKAKGEFVCLADDASIYSKQLVQTIDAARAQFPEENVILTRSEKRNPQMTLVDQSTKALKGGYKRTIVDQAVSLGCYSSAFFIRKEALEQMEIPEICDGEIDAYILMKLFLRYGSYTYTTRATCFYDTSLYQKYPKNHPASGDKNFYIPALEKFYIPLVEDYLETHDALPDWLQKLLLYQLYFRYISNHNAKDKQLLNKEELEEFCNLAAKILKHIDDTLLIDQSASNIQCKCPLWMKKIFLYLKYDKQQDKAIPSLLLEDGVLYTSLCGQKINMEKQCFFEVKAMTMMNGNMIFDMSFFDYQMLDNCPEAICIKVNNKKLPYKVLNIYSLKKCFGVTVDKTYMFQVEIPLTELKKNGAKVECGLSIGGSYVPMNLQFNKTASKLNEKIEHSYYEFAPGWVMVYSGTNLIVHKTNLFTRAKYEMDYCKEVTDYLTKTLKDEDVRNAEIHDILELRRAYFKTRRQYKEKRIWIYFDKLYKAGDNGEYAFRYAMENKKNDGINHYYVINDDAPEYEKLKADYPDNILVYGTLECRLLSLHAENIVATHPDIIEFLGFNKVCKLYVRDLFNANLVCIAHGVTIQKNADYQNRLYDNTMFYTTSSKYEVAHITSDVYGYSKDQVALTGMARFDGLVNNDKKQILITPTWRNNIIGKASRNSSRSYSDMFKGTEYYRIYNNLINDQRIIDTAKKTGYKIIFLLHPAMSAQIDDYDRNDYVELRQASGDMNYEEILTQSSLMITDYSGIHYDFGYMRKPIVYYQPKEIPMRFEEGGMKFKTMAFGPVCEEYEDAVALICDYMEHQCIMPEEYKRRADDFFAFDDFNSCQRIYDAILKWTNDKKANLGI